MSIEHRKELMELQLRQSERRELDPCEEARLYFLEREAKQAKR
jgi:hypothetical protein